MKEVVDRILEQVEADISEIDLYGYNIIETSLSMVHRLQTVLNDLRTKIQTYVFLTKEDEILFSRHRSRRYSVGCYFSIRYTRLKRNALMVAMKQLEIISIGNWII